MPANSNAWLGSAYRHTADYYGDYDKVTVLFFEIDDTVVQPLYFGVFDPGMDATDDPTITPNPGDMWFRVYGGTGAYTDSTSRQLVYSDTRTALAGILLNELMIPAGSSSSYKNAWFYSAAILPSQGEHVGSKYLFKYVVVGAKNPDTNAYTDAANDDFQNKFQVAASTTNIGSPTMLPSVRVFTYSLFVQLEGTVSSGPQWDLYPFVPSGTPVGYYVRPESFDGDYRNLNTNATTSGYYWNLERWDGSAYSTAGPINVSDDTVNTPGPGAGGGGQAPGASNGHTIGSTSYEGKTWHFRMLGGGELGATEQNGVDVWAAVDSSSANLSPTNAIVTTTATTTGAPLRIYAEPYQAPVADHVIVAPQTQTLAAGGTANATLEIVDSTGEAAPYSRLVRVQVSGGTSPSLGGSWVSNRGPTDRSYQTGTDGLGAFTVTDTAAGTVTISLQTDGTSGYSDDFGSGTDVGGAVVFSANPDPLMSSATNLTFAAGNPANHPVITVRANGGSRLTTSGVRIRVPAALSANFGAVPPTAVLTAGTGTLGAPSVAGNVVTIPITVALSTNAVVSIGATTPISYTATSSASSGSLEMSFDGGTNYTVIDDKIVTVQPQVYRWTGGGGDGNWSTAANWIGGVPPGGANILIPNSAAPYPTTTPANLTLGNLSIQSSATLRMSSLASLTVTGTFDNAGTLILNGDETLSLTLPTTYGTVQFAGGGTYSGWDGLTSFYNLAVSGTGAYTPNADFTVYGSFSQSAGTANGGAGRTWHVNGDWSRSGGTFAAGTSTVSFEGSSITTVANSTTFNNLSITTPGKTVRFTGGLTQNMAILTVTGTPASPVRLRSATASQYTLNVTSAASVNYASIQYCIVSPGATYTAYNSENVSNNSGWLWATTLRTWVGTTSAWALASNWNPNDNYPQNGESVVIPPQANNPILSGNTAALTDVTIQYGATLDLAGYFLSASGTYSNSGTLRMTGNQTLTFTNDTDSGTVELSAGGTGTGGFTSFYNLTNSGGTHTAGGALAVNGNLVISGGTLTLTNANSVVTGNVSGAGTLDISALTGGNALSVGGSWSVSALSAGTASLVTLTGTSGAGPFALTTNGQSFAHLTLNAAGKSISQTGTLTVTGNLNLAAGSFSSGGYALRVAGNLAWAAGCTFTPGTTAVEMNGAAGTQTLTSNGNSWTSGLNLSGSGTVQLQDALSTGTLTVASSATLNLNGHSTSVTGASSLGGTIATSSAAGFSVTGATTLTGSASITTAGGNVAFTGTVNGQAAGSGDLTVSAGGGSVGFGAAVGATALAGLDVSSTNGAANAINVVSTVRTTGNQRYNGNTRLGGNLTTVAPGAGTVAFTAAAAVTLNAGITIDTSATNGTVGFGSTVNAAAGTYGLSISAGSGLVSFGGAVGGTAPALASLDVSSTNAAANAITLRSVTTSTAAGGTQSYNAPVTLGTDTTLTGYSGSFTGAITGSGYDLHLAFTSTTTITSTSMSGIGAFTSDGPLDASGTITTSGAQTYNNTVRLIGDVTLNTTDSDVSLNDAVSRDAAARTLTVSAGTGTTSFASTVGTVGAPLGAISITSDGISFSGAVYGDSTIMLQPSTTATTVGVAGGAGTLQLTAASLSEFASGFTQVQIGRALGTAAVTVGGGAADAATFSSPVLLQSGGAGGSVVLVGGVSAGANAVDITASTIDLNRDAAAGAAVSTTGGAITFTGPVNLAANTSISSGGGDISFTSTISSPGTAYSLTLNKGAGTLIFSGLVGGGGSPLSGLSTDAGGAIAINTLGITTTTGGQTYLGAVALGADVSFTGNAATVVRFGGTVGGTGSARSLAVTTADARFDDTVGAGNLISGLSVGGAATINTAQTTTVGAAGQSYNGNVTLGADATLDSSAGNGPITFSSTIDGVHALSVAAGGGDVSVYGTIGGGVGTALSQLSVANANNVTLTGIGTGTQDGVGAAVPAVTVTASGYVLLNGQHYKSTGSQTYSAAQGVRLMTTANGDWSAGGAGISLPSTDLYVDANGVTINLHCSLSCNRFVFYRGTLDISGQTLTTTGDLAAFGFAYDPDDPDGTPGNNAFAYVGAAMALANPGPGLDNAVFSDLSNATINVGANFYVNGADMQGAADWFLNIPDNSDSDIWGFPVGTYAKAFRMQASHSVAGPVGWVAAASSVGPGDQNNLVVDNGNNTNWEFGRPAIASVQTINDNLVHVSFRDSITGSPRPIENSQDEIAAAVGSVTFTGGTFAAAFLDAACTVSASDGNDHDNFYIRTSGGATWNTDAVGSGVGGVNANSTDSTGTYSANVPDIALAKAVFYDEHKNPIRAENYTATTDGCGPVLYRVEYGRTPHGAPPITSRYDGHNFFWLHWSEPVTIGTLPAPGGPTVFTRSGLTFGDMAATGATPGSPTQLIGFFTYTDPGNRGPMSRGSTDATATTNVMFRTTDYDLVVYLCGWASGADQWPGWQANVPDPAAGACTFTAESSSFVADLALPTANSADDNFPISTAAAVLDPSTGGAALTSWDVDTPIFSLFYDTGSPPPYEIISLVSAVTGRVSRLEFHIQDNSAENSGPYPPPRDTRSNHGIRDSTLPQALSAFAVNEVGATPLVSAYNSSMTTDVASAVFGAPLNIVDDPYFALNLDDATDPWTLLTPLYVSYDSNVGHITDLAGNLLPSTATPLHAIERTPPFIKLALAAVGGQKVRVTFSKPVYGNNTASAQVGPGQFSILGTNAISGVTVTQAEDQFGALEAEFTLAQPLNANEAVADRLLSSGAGIFDRYGTPMDPTATHRITDIGIGVMIPVWASDGVHGTAAGAQGALTAFDGTGFLLPATVTVQASIQADGFTGLPTSLSYDVSPPEDSVVNGFWLPTVLQGLLPVPNLAVRSISPISTQNQLRNFAIPGTDSEVKTGAAMEFVLKLGDLYCAQLTDPDDLTSLAPWSFTYRQITEQREGVTILNNVINPLNNEQAFLKYRLETAGNVTVQVFALDGSLVKVLFRGRQGSGDYTFAWDGTNRDGRAVARGIYFIRVVAPGIDEIRKVLVVK